MPYPNQQIFIPFWYDAPEAWDQVTLGSLTLPGKCKVTVKRGRKIDIKRPPGSHGATLTDQGYDPARVNIEWAVWTADDWNGMQAILPQIEPPPNKSVATPFDILHPKTAVRQVTSILIEDIEGPDEDGSVKGMYVCKLNCVQYLPPKKKSVTSTPQSSLAPFSNALTAQPASPPSSKGQGAAKP